MTRPRHSIPFAGTISIFALLSAGARPVDGLERGYYSGPGNPLPGKETWASYYAKHAQASNSPEKRLANGVRWQLTTDRRTNIAIPRIVWMPNHKSRDIANRMLEMVHGGAMLFSKEQQRSRGHFAKNC